MGVGPHAAPLGLLPAAPPRYSLLTIPGVVVPGDARWENGIGVQPDGCDVDLVAGLPTATDIPYWWQCPADGGDSAPTYFGQYVGREDDGIKQIGANDANLESDAFTIWAGYTCTAMEAGNADEMVARATRRLNAVLPPAVEHELWTGTLAAAAGFANDAFMDAGSLTNLGGPLGFVTALAEVEQSLAEHYLAGRTMIHAQPRVVTAWASRGLVAPNADRTALVTTQGTVVVPGHGYPGTPPTALGGPAVGRTYSYVYGTSWVNVWLGAVDSSINDVGTASVEREQNDVEVRAERPALTIWDPCVHVGAWVGLCDEYCGTGS